MSTTVTKKTTHAHDIGIDGECPICAQNHDPATGGLRYNTKALAAIEECNAVIDGKIPAKFYKPHELDEALKELDI